MNDLGPEGLDAGLVEDEGVRLSDEAEADCALARLWLTIPEHRTPPPECKGGCSEEECEGRDGQHAE